MISASEMNSATKTDPVNTPAIAIIPVSSIALSPDPLKSLNKTARRYHSGFGYCSVGSLLAAIVELPLLSAEFATEAATSPSVAAAPNINSVSGSEAARIST